MTGPRRNLVVVAGPSGVGKGTVVRALRERHPEIWYSVSATTRSPRPGEEHGREYFFLTPEEFTALERGGGMLETAKVFGLNRYGTPAAPVERALAEGKVVLLEVDLDGARQIRAKRPDAYMVFIAPPSFEELARRLTGRGTETTAERERRLATAREELAAAREFDAVVTNDTVERAAGELAELLGLAPR